MTGFLKKIAVWVLIPFLFCTLCIGYAQLSDTLNIQGVVEHRPPAGVFITDVSPGSGVTVNHHTGTIVNSTANLSGTTQVTMEVTVYNNSSVVYGYNLLKYVVGDATYDNENIQVTTTMEKKDENWTVQPYSYLTFPVTFSYVKNASTANSVLNSVIEFEFLPWDEIPDKEDETTVSNAMDRFDQVLNSAEEKALLDNYMDNPPSNRNSSYISNVPDAAKSDIAVIEELFSGNLHVSLDGQQVDVKILIKDENVTNSYNGNEMTIYMTTDPLTRILGTAVVYRCVFAYQDGTWIRISEMTAGKARICGYDGSIFGTGSFNTDKWEAS